MELTGQTPFLRAALSGDLAVMKLLLEKGADPNTPTVSGTTALMAAAGVNWVVGADLHGGSRDSAGSREACALKRARTSMRRTPWA